MKALKEYVMRQVTPKDSKAKPQNFFVCEHLEPKPCEKRFQGQVEPPSQIRLCKRCYKTRDLPTSPETPGVITMGPVDWSGRN